MQKNHVVYEKLMQIYDQNSDANGISGKRLAERIAILAQIGKTESGGVNRPGFSEEEKAAKAMVKKWMLDADMTVKEDGAGNLIGRIEGTSNQSKAIAAGSHVDTVPDGGNFDGTVGVLTAIEVAAAWKTQGIKPSRPYEVYVFSDEEGARFNSGLTGSIAMAGDHKLEEVEKLRDYNGWSFTEVLDEYGSNLNDFMAAKRDLSKLESYVEVHIEQGKKLEAKDLPVGIVSGIAGPAWLQVTYRGQAGHAGNTPMPGRKDALRTASKFIQAVADLPEEVSETAVATIGQLHVKPNGANVIPGEVEMSVDIRDIHEETRDRLLEKVLHAAGTIAEEAGIHCQISQTTRIQPIPIPEDLQQQLADIMMRRGIEPQYIPSGAGHDAMALGKYIPISMIFVRSQAGISHDPKEWSSLNDIVEASHILKIYIEKLMHL